MPVSDSDFRRFFENAPDHYLILDPDLTIVAATDAYLAATMTKRENVLGRNVFSVFPDNPAESGATGVQNLRASLERVLRLRVPDSMAVQKYDIRRGDAGSDVFEARYWSPRNSPVLGDDGRLRFIVHRVEDVTEYMRLRGAGEEKERLAEELKRKEADIYNRAHELQLANQELRRIERELRQANDAAEALGRELEAFSYSVAHDLRAPLRAIMGFAKILNEDFGAKLPEEGKKFLDHIVSGSARMEKLIHGLLDLSRISRTDSERAHVDLSAIAREIGRDLQAENPARAWELKVEDGLETEGDPRLLGQLLANLLSNAWKYTAKRPGTAHVEFGRSGGTFFVRDDGCGFDMRFAERLFGMFQRLHRSDDYEGNGIGLALVRKIVHSHGGKVWAEGEVGKGATFFFTLPPR